MLPRLRKGVTLVETLVVVGILALLLAMALPTIQRMRAAANRLGCQNQARQIMLGLHHYATSNQGRLPGYEFPYSLAQANPSPLEAILPYVECEGKFPYYIITPPGEGSIGCEWTLVKLYISKMDPSFDEIQSRPNDFEHYLQLGPTSFVSNMLVHTGRPYLSSRTIPDGLSYTIGLAERYFYTGKRNGTSLYAERSAAQGGGGGFRRPTFCDASWRDVMPITFGNPLRSLPSVPNVTFQVAPRILEADDRMLQASQPSGLLTVMYDGSIRTFPPNITQTVFWGAITPRGGEVIELDW